MAYLVIILICLVVFARSLKYGVVVDDIANRKHHQYASGEMRRPLWKRIRRNLNGEYPVHNIVYDHCITLAIHTAVCCLIYYTFGNLPAAILFAVNVSNNQVSLWLNGKRYGVNTILCMLAYNSLPFGIVFWMLTGLFQVSAVSFPIVMMLAGSWWFGLLAPVALLVGDDTMLSNIKRRIDRFSGDNVKEYVRVCPQKAVFALKTIAFYFLRGIIPYIPTMYPEQYKDFGLTDKANDDAYRFDVRALAGLALAALTVIGYIISPSVFFGMAWWLVTILVFGNIITLTLPIAERYMYLPNVGLMLTLAIVLSMIHPLAWTYIAIIYAVRLMAFMPMYKDIDRYLKHHTFYYPKNDQGWMFRANRHASNGDAIGVLHLSNEGLLNNQNSWWLWLHRANGFQKIGQTGLAGACVKKARECAVGFHADLLEKKLDTLKGLKEAVV